MSRRGWFVAVPLAACLAVYAVSFGFEFVSWDDHLHLRDNPHFGPPWLAGLERLWSGPFVMLYNPLAYTWWAAVAGLATIFTSADRGLDPHLFHAANVVLQLVNVALVWRLLVRFVGDDRAAAWGAALFGLHPLAVESVAWVSEARGLLSAALLLAALERYAAYVNATSTANTEQTRLRMHLATNYLAALVLFALALLAKSSAAAGPLMAAVLDVGWFRRSLGKSAVALAPWIALTAAMTWISSDQQAGLILYPVSPHLRPLVALDAQAFYLAKLAWPVGLAIDYGRRPDVVIDSGRAYLTMWVVPLVIAFAAWLPGRRKWLVGLGLFIAATAPVLGLMPFQYQDYSTVADRYAYLALLGPAWCAAWLAADRLQKPFRVDPGSRWSFGLATILLLGLAALSFRQTLFWRNDFALFTRAEEINPISPAALGTLGLYWLERGDLVRAASYWERDAEYSPKKPASRLNLAILRLRQDRYADAIAEAESAQFPGGPSSVAVDVVDTARFALGKFAGSPSELTALAERHRGLAESAALRGDASAALFHARWFARMAARSDAWLVPIRLLRRLDDRAGAIAVGREGVERFPDFAELHNDLGALLAASSPQQALSHYQTAQRLRPDLAEVYNNVGTLLGRQGDWVEAAAQFRRALELKPDFAAAARNLATAEAQLRNR